MIITNRVHPRCAFAIVQVAMVATQALVDL